MSQRSTNIGIPPESSVQQHGTPGMLRLIQTCSAAGQGGQAFKAAVAWMVGVMAAIGVIQALEHKAGGMASIKTLAGKHCRDGLKKLTHPIDQG